MHYHYSVPGLGTMTSTTSSINTLSDDNEWHFPYTANIKPYWQSQPLYGSKP